MGGKAFAIPIMQIVGANGSKYVVCGFGIVERVDGGGHERG